MKIAQTWMDMVNEMAANFDEKETIEKSMKCPYCEEDLIAGRGRVGEGILYCQNCNHVIDEGAEEVLSLVQ